MNAIEFDTTKHEPYTQVEEVLYDAIKVIEHEKPGLAALLRSAQAVEDNGETVTITYPCDSSFAMMQWSKQDNKRLLHYAVNSTVGPRFVKVREDNPVIVESSRYVRIEREEYGHLLDIHTFAVKLVNDFQALTQAVERGGDGR